MSYEDFPLKLAELESELRELLKGKHSNLTLSFNDMNGPNYQTVEEWLADEDTEREPDWVSPEERQRAINNNSWWTLQWYPYTPNGFNWFAASSLPALFEHMRNREEK